jgi:dTDP-L-rhamnose 4-epimerase
VRDLVYIDDVIDALFTSVVNPAVQSRCLDIGSGHGITIHELAKKIAAVFGAPEPVVVGKFRDGDVRAASCDIEPTLSDLQWRPKWTLDDGLRSLLDWIGTQTEAGAEDGAEYLDRVGVERAR